ERFISAAVDEILAHEERLKAVTRWRRALVGDDLNGKSTRHRVVEPRRRRTRADIELARAQRCDHARPGIERHERDVESFCLEVALLVGEIESDVAARLR